MDWITRLAAGRHTQHGPRRQPDRPVRARWMYVDDHPFFTRYAAEPGTDRPVVLVHGLIVSSLYMVPLAARLGDDHEVLAPDLPSIGYTPGPRGGRSVQDFTDDLAAWIRAAGLTAPPVVVGNSMGCQMASDLAVRYPGLCSGLVLQGPTTDPERRRLVYQIIDWMRAMPLEPLSQSVVMAHDVMLSGPSRWIGNALTMLEDHIEDRLPYIPHPTLVIRGTKDPIVSESWARRVCRLVPDATLRHIPGAAHTANYSAPLEMARICRPFIRECLGETERRGEPTATTGRTRRPETRPGGRH